MTNAKERLLLATGVIDIDVYLTEHLQDAYDITYCIHQDLLIEKMEQDNPRYLVLTELLDKRGEIRGIITDLKKVRPDMHIVYIMREENVDMRTFLNMNGIDDILVDTFTHSSIQRMLEGAGHDGNARIDLNF